MKIAATVTSEERHRTWARTTNNVPRVPVTQALLVCPLLLA
jgi:hypothetical protein